MHQKQRQQCINALTYILERYEANEHTVDLILAPFVEVEKRAECYIVDIRVTETKQSEYVPVWCYFSLHATRSFQRAQQTANEARRLLVSFEAHTQAIALKEARQREYAEMFGSG